MRVHLYVGFALSIKSATMLELGLEGRPEVVRIQADSNQRRLQTIARCAA